MHKHCPSCHQLLDESVQLCPICGTSVVEVQALDAPVRISEGELAPPLIQDGTGQAVSAPSALHHSALGSVDPNLLKPAFLGAIILGVLSAIPLVNCCCFLWVSGAGIVAVYFLRQEYSGEITPGLGAKLGFLTGILGALFWQVLELPISYIKSPEAARQLQELLKNQNIPSQALPFIERIMDFAKDPFNPLLLIIGISFKLLACGILTTLGGVLGSAFWGKPKSP